MQSSDNKSSKQLTENGYDKNPREIITFFLKRCGYVSPGKIAEARKRVREMHYDIPSPVQVIFNVIIYLSSLAESAGAFYSDQQK